MPQPEPTFEPRPAAMQPIPEGPVTHLSRTQCVREECKAVGWIDSRAADRELCLGGEDEDTWHDPAATTVVLGPLTVADAVEHMKEHPYG